MTNYDIEDQDTAAATLSQIQEVFQKVRFLSSLDST